MYFNRWSQVLISLLILSICLIAVIFSWHMHQHETGVEQLFFKVFGGFFGLLSVALLLSFPKQLLRMLNNNTDAFLSFRVDDSGIYYSELNPEYRHHYDWTTIESLSLAHKTVTEDSDGKYVRKHALVVFFKTAELAIPDGFISKARFFQERGINHTTDKRYYIHQQLPKDKMDMIRRHLENISAVKRQRILIHTHEVLDLN